MQPRQKQNTNACMITSGVFSAKVSVPGATVLRTRGATKSVSSQFFDSRSRPRPRFHTVHTVRCLGWRQEPRARSGKGQGADGATEGHGCSLDYRNGPEKNPLEGRRCTGLLAGANGRHKAGFSAISLASRIPSQVATEGSSDSRFQVISSRGDRKNSLQILVSGASKAEFPTAVVAVTLCLMEARARC